MMKPSQAIELVSNVENSYDLLLCGIDGIQNASYSFSVAQYYNSISADNSVSNVFGLGEDNKFFYSLLSFKDNNIVKHEHGIGYGYEKDGKHYFCRYFPLYNGTKRIETKRVITNHDFAFDCNSQYCNVLVSTVPEDYAFAYFDKNCILVSTDVATPVSKEVKPHSFLARVDDDDVSNLSFDSKAFADIIGDALSKYTKQLGLKCSKLNANKLAIKQLQLEPSDGVNAKAGTFIYDSDTDTVRFYNGIKWRTLKWEEDEKME